MGDRQPARLMLDKVQVYVELGAPEAEFVPGHFWAAADASTLLTVDGYHALPP